MPGEKNAPFVPGDEQAERSGPVFIVSGLRCILLLLWLDRICMVILVVFLIF